LGYNTKEGALGTNTTGSGNTALGFNADVLTGDLYNATAIGYWAVATASDQVRIGDDDVTSIGGYANWSNISDGRVKKNIKSDVPGLAFINKLQPVTYNLDLDAADKIVQRPAIKDKDARLNDEAGQGKIIQISEARLVARKQKEQIVYTGFVAQDVEKTAKEIDYDFSGVDAAKNDKDLYGLRYAEFVVPLVKAVQELSKMNDEKDAKINDQQKQNDVQQKEIDDLKSEIGNIKSEIGKLKSTTLSDNSLTINLSDASLAQNVPNPFTNSTAISYRLPSKFTTAQIIITDKNGKQLKQLNISGTGKGSMNVAAATLSSGTYNYSLIIDGKVISSKQMVLVK